MVCVNMDRDGNEYTREREEEKKTRGQKIHEYIIDNIIYSLNKIQFLIFYHDHVYIYVCV